MCNCGPCYDCFALGGRLHSSYDICTIINSYTHHITNINYYTHYITNANYYTHYITNANYYTHYITNANANTNSDNRCEPRTRNRHEQWVRL